MSQKSKFIHLSLIVLMISSLYGCKSSPQKVAAHTPQSAKKEFEKGLKELDQQQYSSAIAIFDRLLVQNPATELDLVILYNSAVAYEGLAKCDIANDRYRKVVKSSTGKYPLIESQALFRQSMTYECMGQDTKTITSLLDTLRRASNLAPEIVKAEIPARIAAAYARLGNKEKALEYFNIASKGLKNVVSTTRGTRKELLGQTMYLMGQLSESQRSRTMDPIAYAQSLYIQQPYLLQAAEVGHPVYSEKAADDLILAYENTFKYDLTDENRSDFYLRTIQNIVELKRLKLIDESDLVAGVYDRIGKIEARLQAELAKTGEITKLTDEATKKQGLKREGKIISKETILEKGDLPKKRNTSGP